MNGKHRYEKNIKVSIIVPIYNVEKYLDACLWSLRKQTYDEFEIIVVDDKSPDNSVYIAQRHAEEDSRLKIYYHEKNRKLGAARNTGIQYAQGKYIMFLDSDDLYPLDAVYNMLVAIESSKADMVIGRAGWLKEGKIIPVNYIEHFINEAELLCEKNLKKLPAEKWYLGQVGNRIYRLETLKEWNILFDEGVYWEDMAFSAKVWYRAKIIKYIDQVTYLRTERQDSANLSITQEYGMKKYLDRDYLEKSIFEYFVNECKKNLLVKKDIEILLKRIYYTTQTIVPLRNDDIAQWTEEWFEDHKIKHEKLMEELACL